MNIWKKKVISLYRKKLQDFLIDMKASALLVIQFSRSSGSIKISKGKENKLSWSGASCPVVLIIVYTRILRHTSYHWKRCVLREGTNPRLPSDAGYPNGPSPLQLSPNTSTILYSSTLIFLLLFLFLLIIKHET